MTTTTIVDRTLWVPQVSEVPQRASQLAGAPLEKLDAMDEVTTVRVLLDLARIAFGCEAAGVLLQTHGRPVATAATDGWAARADQLQAELRQGPGLVAIERRQPVTVAELRADSRWRVWSPLTADLGFRSVLSLSLAQRNVTGALNLYARTPAFFRPDVLVLARAFTRHASLGLAMAVARAQRGSAGGKPSCVDLDRGPRRGHCA